ncbi:hypothetical protein BE20_02295 [Sorangium cellulosum]|uniref:Uncharacterized protein n=1 Tax=Sorangium cellulosum TaxID=56 RepID=A0A150R8B2_SORCE|nr:hypothetical protein BE18_18760 [Sorangium cellulosum]KYF89919.1 hypothetical protein BE20_02295 [Sorangium cellulosum]
MYLMSGMRNEERCAEGLRLLGVDVLFSCSEARCADGFGTIMDYRCVLLDRGSEAYYWAFDFGLLQRVWRWEDLSQDEVEALALGDDLFDVEP